MEAGGRATDEPEAVNDEATDPFKTGGDAMGDSRGENGRGGRAWVSEDGVSSSTCSCEVCCLGLTARF